MNDTNETSSNENMIAIVGPSGVHLMSGDDFNIRDNNPDNLFVLEAVLSKMGTPLRIHHSGWEDERDKFVFISVEKGLLVTWLISKKVASNKAGKPFWQLYRSTGGTKYRKRVCQVGDLSVGAIYEAIEKVRQSEAKKPVNDSIRAMLGELESENQTKQGGD